MNQGPELDPKDFRDYDSRVDDLCRVWQKLHPKLRRLAASFNQDWHHADDYAQDSFLKALPLAVRAHIRPSDEELEALLLRTLWPLAMEERRKRKRSTSELSPNLGTNPWSTVEQSILIDQLISGSPPDELLLFELKLEGNTSEEIVERVEKRMPVQPGEFSDEARKKAVRRINTTLHRARERIKLAKQNLKLHPAADAGLDLPTPLGSHSKTAQVVQPGEHRVQSPDAQPRCQTARNKTGAAPISTYKLE
jgi:DNA-directed RNA polymerase specialized sigma24 family protein